ncbi:MAG: hypothetical protein Q9211_002743 [Gyalolechia sp. 1 TL-2023]
MDESEYERTISEARLHYGRKKPEFARMTRITKPGDLREVVLPTAAGKYPVTSKEIEFGVLTAVKWDYRYFFWSLDNDGKYSIVSGFPGYRDPYKPWLGVEKGYGDQPVAFGLSSCCTTSLDDTSDTTDSYSSAEAFLERQGSLLSESPFHSTTSASRKRTMGPATAGPSQKKARLAGESNLESGTHRTADEADVEQLERRQPRPITAALEATPPSLDQPVQSSNPSRTIPSPKESDGARQTKFASRERILKEKLKILVYMPITASLRLDELTRSVGSASPD